MCYCREVCCGTEHAAVEAHAHPSCQRHSGNAMRARTHSLAVLPVRGARQWVHSPIKSTASRSGDRCAGNLRGSPQTRRIQRSLRRDDWYANIRDKRPLVPFRWTMSLFFSAVLSANLRNCEAVRAVSAVYPRTLMAHAGLIRNMCVFCRVRADRRRREPRHDTGSEQSQRSTAPSHL
jgi:hypothetical protein